MATLDVNGKQLELDEDGFLVDMTEWSEDVALALAKTEEVEMTDNHWEVVNFLREYYEEYKIAPMIRILTKALGKKRV